MSSPPPFSLTSFVDLLGAPGAVVLDLGCGTGRHARALRDAGFRVRALDSDVDALSTAQSLESGTPGLPPVSWCAGRAESLPFAAAVFDAVVCLDVLHWSSDAAAFEAAWREAWRVLRPGGRFFARLRVEDFRMGETGPASGWFLPARAALEEQARLDGAEWLEPLARDGSEDDGAARFLLRKRF